MFKSLFNLFIKHQDSNPENPNNPSTPASSNNILKSLFNLDQNSPKDSIFSDSNPFRTTKPVKESQKKQLQEILHLDIDSPQNNDTQIPKSADNKLLSKRKRKEKIPTKDFGSDGSDIETEVKKLKIEDGFVLESDKVVNFDEKKKKKSKRGEVEAEYDERKYGGVHLENKEVEEGKRKIGVKRKEVDKGEELLVAKEGFDDEAKLLRTEVKKLKIEDGFVLESDKVVNFDEKKKKKRKRGEVEAEYEERKYGGVDLENKEVEEGKRKIGVKRKEVDKGVELLVAKEGFDDEAKLLRTVFVGNLPLKVMNKKKALMREFSQFGEIESIRIRSTPLLDDKTPRRGAIIKKQINDAVDRVNAYIVFKMEDSAQASLSHNMAVVGGNHIHVDRTCPPRKKLKGENAPLYDSKRTVFIGNLPFDVKDEELYQLFTGFNNLKDSIEAIRVVRDPGTSMGKGIAYVLFQTREAANTVVRKHKLKIRDRELRLSHALKANSTPLKQKEPSSSDSYNPSKKAAVGTNPSYQGIQATKSGGQKKFATRIAKPVRTESRSQNAVKRKVRSEKRPAVAARKAAANATKTGGDGGGGGGMKRKPENRTPQSNSKIKKPRKFR